MAEQKQPKEVRDAMEKVKQKKKKNNRFKIGCVLIFLLCNVVLLASMATLWLTGHLKTWTCDVVQEDSYISETANCKDPQSTSEEGEGEFKYTVVEEGGDVVITDQEQVITSVVEESSDSVVSIGVRGSTFEQDQIIGTGFIVSSNGLIVTNQHVVASGDPADFFVLLDQSEEVIRVEEVYIDAINDIGIIKIDRQELPTLPLGDSDNLRLGQTVIAIGNPLGEFTGTITTGIISGLNRDVEISSGFFDDTSGTFEDVIQTDAAVNPGNSGGPLINSNGEVIGVNFATIQGADNLSFAIPINRIKTRIQEINDFGRFRIPFMGIEFRRRVVFFSNEAVIGARVLRVLEGSPADQAGILEGDVIVQYDGISLEDSNLFTLIQKSEIGQEVEVVVIREGEQETLEIIIGERE